MQQPILLSRSGACCAANDIAGLQRRLRDSSPTCWTAAAPAAQQMILLDCSSVCGTAARLAGLQRPLPRSKRYC